MGVTATAPGKLFLLGEYAVLHGAPALLAAMDARCRINLEPADCWRVTARPLGLSELILADDGAIPAEASDDVRRALTVFDAVRRTVATESELRPLQVTIDTTAFFRGGHKLGLGASAAVAVALTAGLHRLLGHPDDPATVCNTATAAHRLAQGGEGSGADVATATHGGIVEFAAGRPAQPRAWPAGLHARPVMTGNGADTRELVAAVRRLATTDPTGHAAAIRRLADLADQGRAAVIRSDIPGLLTACRASLEALATLGVAAGADIVTAQHRALAAAVAETGAVFKTTGAGGGDLGLILAASPSVMEAARRAAEALGHTCPPLAFGAGGVAVTDVSATVR
ncbi:hypothetical protein [Spectribacter hydrogenoxidans]|uniref:GHMP kinase N-terminal domain-containing protein n=1 Tax=Spectribacter hydrogenoxidans TaxID=3075608 RepID=A0ABU3C2K3_9GAMM|nr:hypothetical protein [Salinisphaera sp. W335]MDT0635785.1 hypothetical protein [Salinisphaera sp. W335]